MPENISAGPLDVAAKVSCAPAAVLKSWRQRILTAEDPNGVAIVRCMMPSATLHERCRMTSAAEHRRPPPSMAMPFSNALPNPVLLVAPTSDRRCQYGRGILFRDFRRSFCGRQSLKELVPFGSPLLALIDQSGSSGSPVNEYKAISARRGWWRPPGRSACRTAHGTARPYRGDAEERTIADKMDRN